MVEIIYRDFLSGRVKVPLIVKTVEDKLGFSTESICLSKDIRLILDDGSAISFDADTNIDVVASKAELTNELLKITEVSQIKVFDSSETIKTNILTLRGAGFYDGFQEWWFVHRVFGHKSVQFLRFNLEVTLDDGEKLLFQAGTDWTVTINKLENYHMVRIERPEKREYETVICTRRCHVPYVPVIDPDNLPEDLLKDVDAIISSDE